MLDEEDLTDSNSNKHTYEFTYTFGTPITNQTKDIYRAWGPAHSAVRLTVFLQEGLDAIDETIWTGGLGGQALVMVADEAAYDALTDKEPGTIYYWP